MKLTTFTLIFLLVSMAGANADFGLELQLSQNATENLLSDSTEISDFYSANRMTLSYYPVPQAEIRMTSEYNYYTDLVGLGSIAGGGGFTVIPTTENSRFNFYFSGDFVSRSYRDAFSDFNTNDLDLVASVGYSASRYLRFRSGISYENSNYIHDDDADKESYQLFGGLNFSFLGKNSLDLEFGYAFANYNFIDSSTIFTYPQKLERFNGDLRSIYISPRFSRPISKRIGFNIVYSYSEFSDAGDKIVFDYSSGYLSPWASVWAGNSVTVNFKAFPFRDLVATAGFGYFSKNFLESLQLPFILLGRHDYQRSWYLGLSWPFTSHGGIFIEPSLQVRYTNNSSSRLLYNYNDLLAVVGMTFRI